MDDYYGLDKTTLMQGPSQPWMNDKYGDMLDYLNEIYNKGALTQDQYRLYKERINDALESANPNFIQNVKGELFNVATKTSGGQPAQQPKQQPYKSIEQRNSRNPYSGTPIGSGSAYDAMGAVYKQFGQQLSPEQMAMMAGIYGKQNDAAMKYIDAQKYRDTAAANSGVPGVMDFRQTVERNAMTADGMARKAEEEAKRMQAEMLQSLMAEGKIPFSVKDWNEAMAILGGY